MQKPHESLVIQDSWGFFLSRAKSFTVFITIHILTVRISDIKKDSAICEVLFAIADNGIEPLFPP